MTRGHPTRAVVHLGAVRENFAEARRLAGGRRVIAVVKADAYGHGAVPVARTLAGEGCEQLAVATVAEAGALREAGIDLPILVLGGVYDRGEAEAAVRLALTPAVHHAGHVELLAAAAPARAAWPVHVEVDTGMRRSGAPADEALALLAAVEAEPTLRLEGVYTHLARGDEADLAPSLEQLARLRSVLAAARERGIAPEAVHALHSAGLLAGKPLAEALAEATAVRPGLMLYGALPAPHLSATLRPAMTLTTRVAHVRSVRAGDGVGYGATYRAPGPTRIATIPVGYADGLPLAASNRGGVRIRGRAFPFAGRVSMDSVGVDVGDAPVEIGDEVTVFGGTGPMRLPVEQAAEAAGTIAYELLVRVGARVPREFED